MGLTIQRPSVSYGACPDALRGRVRLYELEYDRFLSTDVLWSKYRTLQPYQYAANSPVMAVDVDGRVIIPINLTTEQYAEFARAIATLKKLDDPFIRQVVDYAESQGSRIHLYSMPGSKDVESATRSLFGYAGSIETYWNDDYDALGMTIQTPRMASSGQADIILASDEILANATQGQPLLGILDELHHVCVGLPGKNGGTQEHLQLYTYLLQAVKSGTLVLPGLSVQDIEQRLEMAVQQGGSDPSTANPSAQPVIQEDPK